jgi:hypothetical protein
MKTGEQIQLCCPLFLLLGALFLAGCSSVSTQIQPFVGGPSYAPTDEEDVQVLRAKPARAFEPVGRVVVDATGNPSKEKIEQEIEKGAAKLGADAAFVVQDQTRTFPVIYYDYSNWTWGGEQVASEQHREIIALAIRYKGS